MAHPSSSRPQRTPLRLSFTGRILYSYHSCSHLSVLRASTICLSTVRLHINHIVSVSNFLVSHSYSCLAAPRTGHQGSPVRPSIHRAVSVTASLTTHRSPALRLPAGLPLHSALSFPFLLHGHPDRTVQGDAVFHPEFSDCFYFLLHLSLYSVNGVSKIFLTDFIFIFTKSDHNGDGKYGH